MVKVRLPQVVSDCVSATLLMLPVVVVLFWNLKGASNSYVSTYDSIPKLEVKVSQELFVMFVVARRN